MAHSTPTLPLELPPYTLIPLLTPVFPPLPSTSRPTSPSKLRDPPSPQHPASSRFGQLVSSVAAGAGTVAAAAGSVAGAAAGATEQKPLAVRGVEAGDQRVWVGASDGRIRVYDVREEDHPAPTPTGLLSPPGSPGDGRRTPVKQHSVLDFVDEVVVTPTRKAADRIALLPRLDKAIIFSEGIMTFHTLPSLAPLNVHQFPSIRGVATFALDEEELAGGGQPGVMNVCAIKRKTIHWLRITNDGVTSVQDLPLKGGALLSVFRRGRICIANLENYAIVDLEAAEALPLLPISQAPHPDPLPTPSTATTPGGAATPPAPGGPDPRQRPAIACVAENEFLIASHTGDTTLGVFMTEGGDPCRGTLQWASNVRSLVVDSQYSIALLHNSTIEIHSIHSLEIVQVVTLPTASPQSPLAFHPRSLLKSWLGLELGSATGANKLEPVSIPLLPFSSSSSRSDPPSTPTKRRSRASLSSASLRSSPSLAGESRGKPTTTRTLVLGKNGIYGLTPLTLVVQADALIERGRTEDARSLAEEFEKSAVGGVAANAELSYVYLRLAFLSLLSTSFQDAFALFLRAGCDPRLVVRLFPDLRAPLMSGEDTVEIVKGVMEEARSGKSVDEYILDNLNRNYSPHLQPSVESASTTIELRASLTMTARDCLLSYLMKWRAARRSGESVGAGAGDSRKVDMVVDTTLVKLLAEQSRPSDITVLLTSPHDVVLSLVESSLLSSHLYDLLTNVYLERGEVLKVLDIWTRLVDGDLEGGGEEEVGEKGVKRVFGLVWKTREREVTERYGLWMLKHDQALALKLFIDPKQTLTFDTRNLFAKMSKVDANAADLFLESTVLSERDTDSRLHADLVKRYLDRLEELLSEPEAKAHVRQQETDYLALTASSPSPSSFLFFLTSRYDPACSRALLDRVRLKALLFLGGSSKYDISGAKKALEEMEMKGLRGLTLERVLVYGKLKLDRQALSLLLHTLHDFSSAETYSLQCGDPLSTSEVTAAASTLNLPFKRSSKTLSAARREEEEKRKQGLARLLVEMCLTVKPTNEGEEIGVEGERVASKEQVARLLETQAVHLDTLSVLPLLPSDWPIHLLSSYLTRSLRRSLHSSQEASILKSLASAQNLAISERLFDMQEKAGPTVQLSGGGGGGGEGASGKGKEEKREKKLIVVGGQGTSAQTEGEKAHTSIANEAVELDLC